jgi:hypothetical protein
MDKMKYESLKMSYKHIPELLSFHVFENINIPLYVLSFILSVCLIMYPDLNSDEFLRCNTALNPLEARFIFESAYYAGFCSTLNKKKS